jgi:nucleoside-diphosphate-sugar epimerase
MKRLLITGARGFIGRHCLAYAIAAGFEVWATASNHALLPEDLKKMPVKWRAINLLEYGAVETLVDEIKPTHMLHTAWETTHGSYWSSPANLEWLALGTRLITAFAANGGKRFVAAGTCAEYDWNHGYMIEGKTPECPSTFYGKIKLTHHHTLMAAAQHLGFSACTGRVFFAYGPHENHNRLIPYACKALMLSNQADFASGMDWRDFMYVDDVAKGFIALLESDLEGACNICSATPTKLSDIISEIGRLSENSELIRLGAKQDRIDDPPMLVGDNARLRSTGWVQNINLKDGLTKTYEWWKSTN